MGLTGNSPGSLILLFLIAVLLFGSKRLASLGEDLGKAVRGFKEGLKEGSANNNTNNLENNLSHKHTTEDDDNKYNR